VKDLRAQLTQDDPLRLEGELSGIESRRLREQVLVVKPESQPSFSRLVGPITAMLLFVAAGSAWLVRTSVPEVALESSQVRPRQLQFSTPGGTRIIWTFNDNFELR
jgi:hypothetical protein